MILTRSTAAAPLTGARNDLEIQVFGLQRSGNHALVSWLLQQAHEPVVFLNNVAHFEDPYQKFRYAEIRNAVPIHHSKNPSAAQRIEMLRERQKPLLVISYENLNLSKLARRELLQRSWVGISHSICRVLLLRDFYNWLASRTRLFENRGQAHFDLGRMVQPHIRLWLIYAREFVGETRFLGTGNVVNVNFTKWCDDNAHRAALLAEIGLPLRDNSRDRIANVGGGSSFDSQLHSERATSMMLKERWQHLVEERYTTVRETISHYASEIESLNREIFG